jgi:hypothetical protein
VDERLTRRVVDHVDEPEAHGEYVHHPDLDTVGSDQHAEDERQCRCHHLGDVEDPAAIETVGDHASEWSEQQYR